MLAILAQAPSPSRPYGSWGLKEKIHQNPICNCEEDRYNLAERASVFARPNIAR
jgi:hypothetical protein